MRQFYLTYPQLTGLISASLMRKSGPKAPTPLSVQNVLAFSWTQLIELIVNQATAFPQLPLSPGMHEWGHPLVTPDGQTIRVPASAFRKQRQLCALLGNSNRLSPKIYQLIRPEFNCITEGLGRLLGENLSGPSWVLCTCRDCQRKAVESDHTLHYPAGMRRTTAALRRSSGRSCAGGSIPDALCRASPMRASRLQGAYT